MAIFKRFPAIINVKIKVTKVTKYLLRRRFQVSETMFVQIFTKLCKPIKIEVCNMLWQFVRTEQWACPPDTDIAFRNAVITHF
jgi:hypothetical protein